jgi:GntR family transcriptional regulator
MYKQVTDQIKDAITSGLLKPEEKLPSIREMSKELKISMITIKRAYADLENEGYIITRSGMGSYVANINKQSLRQEKLIEIRKDIANILQTAQKFGIPTKDVIALLEEKKENRNG